MFSVDNQFDSLDLCVIFNMGGRLAVFTMFIPLWFFLLIYVFSLWKCFMFSSLCEMFNLKLQMNNWCRFSWTSCGIWSIFLWVLSSIFGEQSNLIMFQLLLKFLLAQLCRIPHILRLILVLLGLFIYTPII